VATLHKPEHNCTTTTMCAQHCQASSNAQTLTCLKEHASLRMLCAAPQTEKAKKTNQMILIFVTATTR
jgi:hypothetical protein